MMMMMRSPQGNGGIESPVPRQRIQGHFHSTVSLQKLRRFNLLIFVLRFASFCFCLASAIFMFSTSRGGVKSPTWLDYDSFRYVAIANSIVGVYSLFEVVAALLEVMRSNTIFPEIVQVWFDFCHDQVFAYMLLSANSAGTAFLRTLKGTETCRASNAFCIQSDISIALGFAGFLFLGLSALLSGFRVVCYVLSGSRFHV